jgi:hypothetical protein
MSEKNRGEREYNLPLTGMPQFLTEPVLGGQPGTYPAQLTSASPNFLEPIPVSKNFPLF